MAVINNTFTEIGDAAIVKTQVKAEGLLTLGAFQDITAGVIPDRYFKKELRYSFDNFNFSDWIEIDSNFVGIDIEIASGYLFFEYRYTREGSNPIGILSWSFFNLETIISRSFLSKINAITEDLYPTGEAWKSKAEVVEFPEVENNYLISFKTIAESMSNFAVSYAPTPKPLWAYGSNQQIGESVDYVFTNDEVKEIFIYAEDPEQLDGNLLVQNDLVFELDLSRSFSNQNLVFPFVNKLRRLKGPKSTGIAEVDFTFTDIEVLDFTETVFQNASILLAKVPNLYFFIQPAAPWSVSNFVLTDSTIYDELNLNKLTINGNISIVDNWFISGIAFNKYADYSNTLSLKIDNCTLLKEVDFSFMNGLLSSQDSVVWAIEIGALSSNVDNMLAVFRSIVPDNGATGRKINLTKNAAPSAAGEVDKLYLQNIGIQVDTE